MVPSNHGMEVLALSAATLMPLLPWSSCFQEKVLAVSHLHVMFS